jgi:hypothetical protein
MAVTHQESSLIPAQMVVIEKIADHGNMIGILFVLYPLVTLIMARWAPYFASLPPEEK